jgi:hypothetical protein
MVEAPAQPSANGQVVTMNTAAEKPNHVSCDRIATRRPNSFSGLAVRRESLWRSRARGPIPVPRGHAAILCVRDPHRHHAQSVGQVRFRANGPPVILKDFHGPPHRDPSADQKTLFKNLSDVIAQEGPSDIPAATETPRARKPRSRRLPGHGGKPRGDEPA